MDYHGPILTDSGGFQVFSLAQRRKISEEGVMFRNEIDGGKEFFSPEVAIAIEEALGADIIMSFDECIPYPVTYDYAKKSTDRTIRWAKRGLAAHKREDQALFGIVQGGAYTDLREYCAKELAALDFPGYSIGGTSIGEPKEVCFQMIKDAVRYLPFDKPRYLMGVGSIDYILEGIENGVDMFDCVMPTRSGRTSQAFTRFGTINIRNARHKEDPRPLEEGCDCPLCTGYSRAYIHHLQKANEVLAVMLLTWHNIRYYQRLMAGLRQAIENDNLDDFTARFYAEQKQGDIEEL